MGPRVPAYLCRPERRSFGRGTKTALIPRIAKYKTSDHKQDDGSRSDCLLRGLTVMGLCGPHALILRICVQSQLDQNEAKNDVLNIIDNI